MAKARNLSDTQQQIAFTEHDFYQRYVETFKTSELGRIKSLLHLREMAVSFGGIEEKPTSIRTKRELARVRATAMEGSFGTQKEHYDLKRVKARTKHTEILYIFFGIHTANVVHLADRIEQRTRFAVA